MNRLNLAERVVRYALATGTIALVAFSMASAQSTPTTTKPVKPSPVPAKAAKPAPAPVAAKPAAMKTTVQTPASVVTPAASRTALPATTTGQTVSPTTTSVAPSNFLTTQGVSNPTQQYAGASQAGTSQAGGSRAPVAVQGLGTFLYGDMTLTVYGCYRSGTRVLCDFDYTKQNSQQLNAPWPFQAVTIVDDGGMVTGIHNAFFMGTDGTQFQTAFVSTTPVRMLMEYDNVNQNYSSVALVYGTNRIQGVPITQADPSQPAGTIPGRGAAATQTSGAATAAPGTAGSPIDGATNAVNNASNTVNTTKQKSKSLWDSLKSATTTK
jgi:hypothetical protein